MRCLLTGGVLFVAVVVTSAIYKPVSFKPKNLAKLFDSRRNVIGNAHHFIQKRQSQACIDAYLEAQTPQFQECSQLFADGSDVTINELLTFCDNDDCVSLLIRVFTDLQSCQGADDNTTQEALKYIHLFCTKNSNGDYCLRLLDNVENGILQPPTNDITNCDFTVTTGRCSNACKNVAYWVKTKLGCCYETFRQAGQIPDEYDIPDGFFTKCNQHLSVC